MDRDGEFRFCLECMNFREIVHEFYRNHFIFLEKNGKEERKSRVAKESIEFIEVS